MAETEVLIAGAGPTGLALALWLTRLGVPVRIIDKAKAPGTTSRALAVQARTLELYREVGLADPMVEAGLRMEAVNLWTAGRKAARVAVGEIGQGLSPFPFVLIHPQDQHERLLIRRLAEAGVEVERSCELVGLGQTPDGVTAQLRGADGAEETVQAAYLAGCDGAHSAARQALGLAFAGGTYEHLFYVADVKARGPVMDRELHISLDEVDFLGVFPLKAQGSARLIGTVRDGADAQPLGWEDVRGEVIRRMGIEVEKVNWFSTYHVHHRVAEGFRRGRVFLLGDAAHIHSPVGGQGMNTGIGDAVNLGWKLAAALQGRADPHILDTYEPERISFARRLVATTDRVFTLVTGARGLSRKAGLGLVGSLFPRLTQGEAARRFLFQTVSQTLIAYPKSPLSRGAAGRTAGGERLPWAGPDSGPAGGDNFTPLASMDWQVHVYGAASPTLQDACAAWGLQLREFPWRESFWRTGLMQDALYLVRPDGHVALADPNARPAALERYVDEWSIKPRETSHEPPVKRPAPKRKAGPRAAPQP
jgi:2-polyprenyl-6-methoxyphenol hydroxylase-like FAD-dependent oxidoreductase